MESGHRARKTAAPNACAFSLRIPLLKTRTKLRKLIPLPKPKAFRGLWSYSLTSLLKSSSNPPKPSLFCHSLCLSVCSLFGKVARLVSCYFNGLNLGGSTLHTLPTHQDFPEKQPSLSL